MTEPRKPAQGVAAASPEFRVNSPTALQDQVRLSGTPISPGLGMGPAMISSDLLDDRGGSRRIDSEEIAGELARLQTAFEHTRAGLQESARRIEEQFGTDLADILRAHEKIL